MNQLLDDENIKEFEDNGFLHVSSFFERSLCQKLLLELKNLDKKKIVSSKDIRSTFLKNKSEKVSQFNGLTYLQKADLLCPLVKEFMSKRLLNYCSKLLKVNDLYFHENEIHIRLPKVSHTIPSHQDNFYFCLNSGLALTCYIYLTKQNRNSGGLGFLPSSIKSKTLNHEKSSIEGFSSFNSRKESNPNDFFYPETEQGDVIFHFSQTFHRADPNLSNAPTSSISIRAFSYSNLEKDNLLLEKYQANLKFNRK